MPLSSFRFGFKQPESREVTQRENVRSPGAEELPEEGGAAKPPLKISLARSKITEVADIVAREQTLYTATALRRLTTPITLEGELEELHELNANARDELTRLLEVQSRLLTASQRAQPAANASAGELGRLAVHHLCEAASRSWARAAQR